MSKAIKKIDFNNYLFKKKLAHFWVFGSYSSKKFLIKSEICQKSISLIEHLQTSDFTFINKFISRAYPEKFL